MRMYCITLNNDHYNKISKIGYMPVGLGKKIISKKFILDNQGENISHKNPFYGEYTFHYWFWKNELKNLKEEEWVGFCQYRKFWAIDGKKNNYENLDELNSNLIKQIPKEYTNIETILGEPIFINHLKLTKFFKKNLKKIITKPSLIFDKNKRNIKFHFDLMHGEGNLEKAISLLDSSDDRKDFNEFVNTEVSFNPHNMFICKSNQVLNNYYNTLFPWLKNCEKEFGFDLEGYGLKRIYGFLAERFMSYWFKKNSDYSTLPIIFTDINNLN